MDPSCCALAALLVPPGSLYSLLSTLHTALNWGGALILVAIACRLIYPSWKGGR